LISLYSHLYIVITHLISLSSIYYSIYHYIIISINHSIIIVPIHYSPYLFITYYLVFYSITQIITMFHYIISNFAITMIYCQIYSSYHLISYSYSLNLTYKELLMYNAEILIFIAIFINSHLSKHFHYINFAIRHFCQLHFHLNLTQCNYLFQISLQLQV
jgi:hypothetical protein